MEAINSVLRVICVRLHAYDAALDNLWWLGRRMPAVLFSAFVSNAYTEAMKPQ